MAVCGTVDARCPPTPIPTLVNDDLLASWNRLQDESVKILQDLIRIDTQNYGEDGGNESEAALYLKKLFDSEGIECTEVKPFNIPEYYAFHYRKEYVLVPWHL